MNHSKSSRFAGRTKAELERARQELKAESEARLRASFKSLKPEATDRELDIMVTGKEPEGQKFFE